MVLPTNLEKKTPEEIEAEANKKYVEAMLKRMQQKTYI